jgi:hypothetical protein
MLRSAHLPVLVLLVAVFGCMAQQPEATTETSPAPAENTVQDLKPASELALLMRTLAAHADSVKAALKRNDKLPPYQGAGTGLQRTGARLRELPYDPLPRADDAHQEDVRAPCGRLGLALVPAALPDLPTRCAVPFGIEATDLDPCVQQELGDVERRPLVRSA